MQAAAQRFARLFKHAQATAGVSFSKTSRCYVKETPAGGERKLRGLTRLIAPTFFKNKLPGRFRKGYVPNVSTRERGRQVDSAITAYAAGRVRATSSPELWRFTEDIKKIGATIIATQVPGWTLRQGDKDKASTQTLCTAADVVLLAPSAAPGGKHRVLVVELKSGFCGPGLDAPLVVHGRRYAVPVGPFETAGRVPITQHLEHAIQAQATRELLEEAYPFLRKVASLEAYTCYIDRNVAVGEAVRAAVAQQLASSQTKPKSKKALRVARGVPVTGKAIAPQGAPPKLPWPASTFSGTRCEWRRVDGASWTRGSLVTALLATPPKTRKRRRSTARRTK